MVFLVKVLRWKAMKISYIILKGFPTLAAAALSRDGQ
jgi:hypothetical protein